MTSPERCRDVSESSDAAPRLRALLAGLAAVVWQADARTGRVTFVSDRAEELLGHPNAAWLASPDFWQRLIHPDDRDAMASARAEATAAGCDHDLSYRAVTADGRVRWLHDLVHVVLDEDGDAAELQGVMIDITDRKHAERASGLLAESGRLAAEPGPVEEKLAALARLSVGAFGEYCSVSMLRDDGLLHRVTVAHADPAVRAAVAELPPSRIPDALADAFASGRPFVVPSLTDELLRSIAEDETDFQRRRALGSGGILVVPLVAEGQVLGALSYGTAAPRAHDAADLTLAEELGRRVALMVQADRLAGRTRLMQEVTAALASAASVTEAATALASGVRETFGASALSVYALEPDGRLRLVHAVGYPPEVLGPYRVIMLGDAVPIADCARTGQPIWLPNRAVWAEHYPHLADAAATTGNHAAAALPLRVRARVVGTLAASFPTPRAFAPDERAFTVALVGQAAQAFERAQAADVRRHIADTFQRALLSPPPEVEGLEMAARYLSAGPTAEVGGDWYDAFPLANGALALVVGDVVGHDLAAATAMAQLRSTLRGLAYDTGQTPGQLLSRLDNLVYGLDVTRFATLLLGTLDRTADGAAFTWASAGHPSPLLLHPDGSARYLPGGLSTPVGIHLDPGARRPQVSVDLPVGATLLLYTDGLVEHRRSPLDVGLEHLAAEATAAADRPLGELCDHLLATCVGDTGDDVALLAVRVRRLRHS